MRFLKAIIAAFFFLPSGMNAQYGLQTHFGDVTYAGGLVYDYLTDRAYITGQVGVAGCFLGVLGAEILEFFSKEVFEETAICQAVGVNPEGEVMLLATAEEGGLYTDLRPTGSAKAKQYGLLVPLALQNEATSAILDGGLILHQDPVQYPRALLQDPGRPDTMYLASLHSLYDGLSDDFDPSDATVPNLTPSGTMKFGSNYFIQVESILISADSIYSLAWRKPFGLAAVDMVAGHDVEFSALLWNQNTLVVVGNTQGSGLLFGDNPYPDNVNAYVARLDPTSGQIWQATSNLLRYTKYDTDGTPADTFVRGACSAGPDSKHMYIVGFYYDAAKSYKEIPFLTQIDAYNLTTTWEQEFVGFSTNAKAFVCTVAKDESSVFLAGVVHDGGSYNFGLTNSAGKDDIFVIEAETPDGHLQWIRQIGTQGNDHVVVNNQGLILTSSGHVVVFGDTDGDLYSTNIKGREIFLASIDKHTGQTWQTTETSSSDFNDGGNTPIKVVVRGSGVHAAGSGGSITVGASGNSGADSGGDLDCSTSVNGCDDAGSGGSITVGAIGDKGGNDDDLDCSTSVNGCETNGSLEVGAYHGGALGLKGDSSSRRHIGVYMTVAVVALIAICVCRGCMRKEEKATERSTVFSYLHAFDLEDIEVRHSATGGWHGTYVGNLANGEGSRLSQVSAFSYSGSHSSVVKDSLFLDFQARTSVNYRDRNDDLYDGVADAHGRIGEDDDDFDNAVRLEESSLRMEMI